MGGYNMSVCTLEEVAASYEMPLELLMQKLNAVVQVPSGDAG